MTTNANRPFPAASRWGWVGLAVIGVALLAIGNLRDVGGDVAGNGPTADTARLTCEDFVAERLETPDGADFGLPAVVSTGRSTWTVSGSVATTNDLGATVQFDYECSVHGDDAGRWSLVGLDYARR